MKDLLTVKREIRALLISSKHGSSPKQLQDAYLQVTGENIPYHFLGHTNFMNFIYSMPDVVSVCRSRNNTVLFGVADNKTRKIKEMVSKQKSSRSTGFDSTFHLRSKQTRTSHTKPSTLKVQQDVSASDMKPSTLKVQQDVSASDMKPSTLKVQQDVSARDMKPSTSKVPLEFQTYLKELMLSHPNGLALRYFGEAFAKRFHYYITFRNWGFNSLEDMIASVPDILTVVNDTSRNIKMIKRVSPSQKTAAREGVSKSVSENLKLSIDWSTLKDHQVSQDWQESDCDKKLTDKDASRSSKKQRGMKYFYSVAAIFSMMTLHYVLFSVFFRCCNEGDVLVL